MYQKLTIYSLLFFLAFHGVLLSQDDFSDDFEKTDDIINITGKVSDAKTGRTLAGANITVDDSDIGAASDGDGSYSIENVPVGSSLTASVIGYEQISIFADVDVINFELIPVIQ